MKLEFSGEVIKLEGEIKDPIILQGLQESSKGQSLEDAFMELLLLGSRVKDVIQTTATTQLLAKSVEDVKAGLEQLETNHVDFLRSLMEELSSEDSNSDIALVRRLRDWAQAFS